MQMNGLRSITTKNTLADQPESTKYNVKRKHAS